MEKSAFSAKTGVVLATAFILIFASGAFADDVTDAVDEAMKYYENGSFSEAAGNLEYAAQLIRQKKGGQLQDGLPAPLPGWSAEDASSQAYGGAMMGGGVVAERGYTKGDSSVRVTLTTDSPMLQAMTMMFSNPMYATADGGKLETVGGRKAIVKYEPSSRSGNVNIVHGHRYLITVEGDSVDKNDLTAYAAAVNYDALDKLQ
jgi:hypothetical protein